MVGILIINANKSIKQKSNYYPYLQITRNETYHPQKYLRICKSDTEEKIRGINIQKLSR